MSDRSRQEGLQRYREKLKSGEVKKLSPAEKASKKPQSLRLAINAKCYDCVGGDMGHRADIKLCPMDDCPLFNLRPYQDKEK